MLVVRGPLGQTEINEIAVIKSARWETKFIKVITVN